MFEKPANIPWRNGAAAGHRTGLITIGVVTAPKLGLLALQVAP